MKQTIFLFAYAAITIIVFSSCSSTRAGVGGYDADMGVRLQDKSYINYNLVPVGDRITYTIDISTVAGKQKLHKLSLVEAKRLVEIEASRRYNCDRLIDPRFDYLAKGKHILRITVDGRPGNYVPREERYDSKTRQEIDVNVRGY